MRNNKVVTGAGRPAYKNPKDMKIKVTYKTYGKRTVSTVIEVNAESIADMLKDIPFNEISEKVGARKREAVKYGYISKIEDLD